MIIDHTHKRYKERWRRCGKERYNGAFYYSKEIVKNIIPRVKTDRNWITVNLPGIGCDHSIVFIHNNLHPEHYAWLNEYEDIILVCGIPETVEKVSHIGKAIYVPLSIDTKEVKKYKRKKEEQSGAAFVGRPAKKRIEGVDLPDGVECIEGLSRDKLLQKMALKEEVYAIGRTAIEAKCLGCKIKKYDPRFPRVSLWRVIDNEEAAEMLQQELDKIDGHSDRYKRAQDGTSTR